MKKFLLSAAAIAIAATMNAQTTFNASDWELNGQTFNKVDGTSVTALSYDNNVITTTIPATADSTLFRFELSPKVDMTLGNGKSVIVMKVEYENCFYRDFDANSFSIIRQIYKGNDNKGEKDIPFFLTDANKTATRMETPIGNKDAKTGYYFRNMADLTTDVDWSKEFTIFAGKYSNQKFTVDGENMYGRSWIGIRLAHSTKNANAIGEGAKANISYIGFVSPEELGVSETSPLDGKMVRTYIEDKLKGIANGVEIVSNDNLGLRTDGDMILAQDADKIEVYNMAGVKVYESAGEPINVAAGLYIVRASNANATQTLKVNMR